MDYFLARYYSSTQGRFTSPDPIFISDKQAVNPQAWNLYNYVENNPLAYLDPTGMERVRLGQHTDKQIKQSLEENKRRKKEIDRDRSLSKEEKKVEKAKIDAQSNTLKLEQQGNKVIGAYLARLDKIGERQGLQVSDFTLTTEPVVDFITDRDFMMQAGAVHGTAIAAKNASAGMFVLEGYSTQIFVNARGDDYRGSLGEIAGDDANDYIAYGGTTAVHERSHRDRSDKSEHTAYTEQLRVLQKFGPTAFKSRDFYNRAVQHITNGTRRPD